MLSSCEKASSEVAANVDTFTEQTKDVTQGISQEIGSLCDNVVKSNDSPDDLPPSKVFEYSKELTSTPDEAIIAAGVSLAEVPSVKELEAQKQEEQAVLKEETIGAEAIVDAPALSMTQLKPPVDTISRSRSALAPLDENATKIEQTTGKRKSRRPTGLRQPSKITR